MKRRTSLSGFTEFQSRERLQNLNRSWQYLSPIQKAWIYARALWHSTPTLYQMIEHIKYFYLRWIDRKIVHAHWVK